MDREGFRNRMKQYKKAREENPGLKYWEWKDIPKYDEGGKVDQDEYSPVWPRISKTERQIYFDRINPAAGFGFGDFIAQGMNYYFPEGERQKAPKEDEARWAAYLGLPYDKKYAPDTKIRFAHDKDYPNRQYQGLSKDAKKEIREEIIPTLQKSYSKLGDKWILITDEKPTDIIRNDEMYYPRLNHIGDLGKFGIREVNGSGIYEVGDKYDFPWYVPIPNRADGHELMIRDTIWSDRAKPELYIQRKAEGGQVEPDPLEVLERSKPKVAGIPINDKPLSGTDPIGEAMMWGLGGGAASVALRSLFPTYGATAGWLAFGDHNKENVLIVPNNVNKSKLPIAKDLVNYDVKEFFENDVVPRDVIYPIESKQSFLNDANFMYDIYPESHFELNVAGYYDNINKKVVVNNLYAGDLKSINRIGTHEFGHKYNDQFELDDPHKRILNNAYTVEENKIGRTARGARRTNEKRETNKNIRYDMYVELLEKLGRSPSPSEVDDFIDSLSDREILRRVRNSNMYGSAYFESISERAQRIKQPIGTYTRTRASKIRKALKQVAMNERSKDNQNYA